MKAIVHHKGFPVKQLTGIIAKFVRVSDGVMSDKYRICVRRAEFMIHIRVASHHF
jgi:hypothetical protein